MNLCAVRRRGAIDANEKHFVSGIAGPARYISPACFTCFEVLGEALRKIEPTLMTGLLFDGQIDLPLQRAVEVGARQLAVRGDLVTPALLAEARKRDLQVVCWTVNQAAHMRLLIEAGVDGIMSDYPDRLVAARPKENSTP